MESFATSGEETIRPSTQVQSLKESEFSLLSSQFRSNNFTLKAETNSLSLSSGKGRGSSRQLSSSTRTENVPWVPDSLTDSCYQCKSYFSLVLRRHHCRRCGNIFCDSCSSNRMPLVCSGVFTPVRVCDKCYYHAAKPGLLVSRKEAARESRSPSSISYRKKDQKNHSPVKTSPVTTFEEALNHLEGNVEKNPTARIEIPSISSSFEKDMETIGRMSTLHSSYSSIHEHDLRDHSLHSDSYLEQGEVNNCCIQTIPGEIVLLKSSQVSFRLHCGIESHGQLYLTNYRLVFTKDKIEANTKQNDSQLLKDSVVDDSKLWKDIDSPGQDSLGSPVILNEASKDFIYDDVKSSLNNISITDYHATPWFCIEKVKKTELPDIDSGIIEVTCKDFRRLFIGFSGLIEHQTFSAFDRTYNLFLQYSSGEFVEEFARISEEEFNDEDNGWALYDPVAEFNRLGVGHFNRWRITSINSSYDLCPSFPAYIAIPSIVSDEVLKIAADFRSKRRIPTLSWRDIHTGSSICRSSQPLVGLGQKQCAQDVFLIQAIASANPSSSKLVIVDARPWRNAVAQKTVGRAGYELTSHYETRNPPTSTAFDSMMQMIYSQNDDLPRVEYDSLFLSECRLVFMGIENIHIMRKSFSKLQEICLSKSSEKFNEQVAASRWLDHLNVILESAVEIVRLVRKEKTSVLVHCSDGWDRTSQLTALAELMLDPFYRTIQGFEILIEKEWTGFGHKFRDRVGHGTANITNETSPIFLQFIDCVWQIQRQFPCSFEFNERFLITLMDELYSCRFGTFLCNSERESEETGCRTSTNSLWSYMNSAEKLPLFQNPFYDPKQHARKNLKTRMSERRTCIEINVEDILISENMDQMNYNEHIDDTLSSPAKESKPKPLDCIRSSSTGCIPNRQERGDSIGIFSLDESGDDSLLPSPSSLPVKKDTSSGFKSLQQQLRLQSCREALENHLKGTSEPKLQHSILQDLDSGLFFPYLDNTNIEETNDKFDRRRFADRNERCVLNESLLSNRSESPPLNGSDDGITLDCIGDVDILIPDHSIKALELWKAYYLRWDPTCQVERNSALELEIKFKDVKADRDALQKKLEDMKRTIRTVCQQMNSYSSAFDR